MLSESMNPMPAGRHSRDDEDEEEDHVEEEEDDDHDEDDDDDDDDDDEDEDEEEDKDEDDDALSLLNEAHSKEAHSLDAAEFSTDSASETLSMSWGSKDSRGPLDTV